MFRPFRRAEQTGAQDSCHVRVPQDLLKEADTAPSFFLSVSEGHGPDAAAGNDGRNALNG